MAWREPHPRRIATPDEVQENKRQIQALDDQINAMIRATDGSAQELLQLQQERANRLSFIAPYRRLPTEILSEIAWHCVHKGIKPSDLNQIDAAMRYAVNGFRALWSRIFVTRSIIAPGKVRGCSHYRRKLTGPKYLLCRNPRYLQFLLDRASPSPLTIKMDAMLIKTIFDVLAPFSAYIKTLEIVEWYRSGPSRFHPLPQLNFRALQHLSFSDTRASCHDFMVHILNTVQTSAINPISFRLSLHPETFQPILRHSAISKAIKLDIESGKISISWPYQLTDMFSRISPQCSDGQDGCDALFAISHHVKDTILFQQCCPPKLAIFRSEGSQPQFPN
jgi:hypothetical protein